MPGVNSVAPRVQGGLLDTVLKGVAVARDIYGIKHEMAATDAAEQQASQSAAKFKDEQAGVIGPKDYLEYSKGYNVADANEPNAIEFKHRTGPTDADVVVTRMTPQKTKSALQQHVIQDMIDPKTGEHGAGVIDSDGALVNFVKTAKPVKDPTPHFTMVPDQDGNPYKVNTLTGDIVPVDADGSKFGKKGPTPEDKAAKDMDKAEKVYTELGTKVETPRGNKTVQQASMNLMSADNALKLAEKYQGNYDKMPPGDYALFVGELSKISTGGIGSQHSQEAIAANTLQSKWAEFKQKIGGDPTPSQLGGFIQNNVGYLNELRGISSKVVNDYKHAIWNSYKNRLPQELQDRFKAEHGDMFPNEQAPGAPAASVATTGSAHGAQAGGLVPTAQAGSQQVKPPAALHPQAAEAAKFVQDNLNSPDPDKRADALKIKAMLEESETPDRPQAGGRRP